MNNYLNPSQNICINIYSVDLQCILSLHFLVSHLRKANYCFWYILHICYMSTNLVLFVFYYALLRLHCSASYASVHI